MHLSNTVRSRPIVAAFIGLALVFGMTVATGSVAFADTAPANPTDPSTPPTVAADALPTAQIDGVAWSQVVVGNTVYVAGKFSNARPAGAAAGVNTTPRNNLLAYDIRTGVLIPSFAPNLNAQALGVTASPDGTRIYVVGDFTAIDGQGYYRIAAFNTATGAIVPSFRPILSAQARSVAVSNSVVYVGGIFKSANGVARNSVAALDPANGSTVMGWDANADASVEAIALTKDGSKAILGGRFANVRQTPAYGLAAVSTTDGALQPWAAGAKVRNGGTKAAITSLYATDDRIYGTGYVFGGVSDGNLEGTFSADPATGEIVWVEDCHGDTYSVFPMGDAVYTAGHPYYCGNVGGYPETNPRTYYHTMGFSKQATQTVTRDTKGYFNWEGNPAPSILNFFPKYVTGSFTGQGQAAWSVSGNSDYLVAGGEFPFVNGTAQQGLVRYAIPSKAPNKVGPNVNPDLVPSTISYKRGEVRISWTATHDQDNSLLTYKLVRDGDINNPVYQTTQASNFWTRPGMGFVDKGLQPGSSHTYRLYVTDPFGNTVNRLSPSVVVASSDAGGDYLTAVEADAPTSYWPLSESSGNVAFDYVGMTDLQVRSGVTRGTSGPVVGTTASSFDGSGNGLAVTPAARPGSNTFSVEGWVRTTSNQGGKILGFGSAATGESASYDRQVYMDDSGRVWFGVYPGAVTTVNSSASYNDGQWHYVVASLGPRGMQLFVDGKSVGARADVTFGQDYSGYWRVGGDNLNGWPAQPSSAYFAGDISNVAIYPKELSKTSVAEHYAASGRTSPIPPAPVDTYGAEVYQDDPDIFWRLDDRSGDTAKDSGPAGTDGRYNGNVTKEVSGALANNQNAAATFDGGIVSSETQVSDPRTYSLEAWFSTESISGGKLIGFGDQRTGLSGNYDRHIYMQDDGRLVFGTYTGQTNTITTTKAYNDGQFHQVAATQSSDGMKLYVDGELVGTDPQTGAQAYNGYWRIGGDTTWGSSSPYFSGTLDEVAVYPTALTADDVATHFAIGDGGEAPNTPPTAAFSSVATNLTGSFDATASTDADGSVAAYSWDFGGDGTATGATADHTFSAAGTYQVTLTVTDDRGATNALTKSVTVVAPPVNSVPVAAFSSSAADLVASFDGSGSSDPDGTIAGYGWNFGDGTTGTGATVNHTYATAGNYTVTLTVTDNAGATGQFAKPITVTAAPPPPPPAGNVLAKDDFGRTVASGWGTADVGGPWTITGGAASSLQVSDGTGKVTNAAGQTRIMLLNSASSNTTDSRITFSLDKVPTGGGYYGTVIGRQVGSANYTLKAWVRADRSVWIVLQQGTTVLSANAIPGLSYTAGTALNARLEVTGTSPTTLNAKIWSATATEPTNWQITRTDSTAALQAAGTVGLTSYLSGSATTPILATYDQYTATTSP